jgi:hypothetical protein
VYDVLVNSMNSRSSGGICKKLQWFDRFTMKAILLVTLSLSKREQTLCVEGMGNPNAEQGFF